VYPGRDRKRTADASDAVADFSGFDSDAPNEKANRPKHVQFRPLVVLAFGRDEFDLQVLQRRRMSRPRSPILPSGI
jgi:hypothetical protein